MRELSREIRYVLRKLRNTPGFTAIAVATLALGIGANTAIFSVVNGVLLQPLPYPEPDRLVMLWHTAPGIGIEEFEQSNTTYALYGEATSSFEAIGVSNNFSLSLNSGGDPVRIEAAAATSSVFQILRAQPLLGRFPGPDDDQWGGPLIAVVGEDLWRSRFGADPGLVGSSIQLQGESYQVIGIAPRSLQYPYEGVQVWVPHRYDPATLGNADFSFEGIARLKDGVTYEAADADLNRVLPTYPDAYPGQITRDLMENAQMRAYVEPLRSMVVGDVEQALWILLGTVGFVLLIATANVANLFLVRAESRQKEVAVRTALGAGASAIVRHYLAEALVLGALGGAVGLGLAWLATTTMVANMPFDLPRAGEIGIHGPVLLFALGASALSSLFFGAVPVIKYARPNLVTALKEGGRSGSAGRETHRARNTLVVAQVALALMLLVGSGLMARSFYTLSRVEPGFATEGVQSFRLSLPEADYPGNSDVVAFYTTVFERIRTIPGVEAVGAINAMPMSGSSSNQGVIVEENPPPEGQLPPIVRSKWASPEYFEAAGIPVLEGRSFEQADMDNNNAVVLVSANFAAEQWPGESAIGKRLANGINTEDRTQWFTVIGVTADVRDDALNEDPNIIVWWPHASPENGEQGWRRGTMNVVVKASVLPTSLMPAIRQAVWEMDARLPFANVRTAGDYVRESGAGMAFTMLLLAIAAGIAVALGTIGIYGVISYIVSQRTREIGVRMALGAERRDVSMMVLRQGAVLAGVGIVLGLVGAFGLTRVMQSLLYGVAATDPVTFMAVPGLLLVVALVASYLPARRAARVAPTEALRYE